MKDESNPSIPWKLSIQPLLESRDHGTVVAIVLPFPSLLLLRWKIIKNYTKTHSKLFPYKTQYCGASLLRIQASLLHKKPLMAERSKNNRKSWFRYFQYDEGRESPDDARNVLLIVAGLIAAVTFQAGVNPLGGVWQDNENGHSAGRGIYSNQTREFYIFLISNTVALSTSILILISLTYRFPFHFEIMLATASMVVTYASAIFAVTADDLVKFRYILAAAVAPFAMRCLLQMWNEMKEKVTDGEVGQVV